MDLVGNRFASYVVMPLAVALSNREQLPRAKAWKIREAEARRAGKILGLAKTYFLRQPDWMVGDHVPAAAAALRPILKSEKPELIYLPHEAEWHPDHQAAQPVLRAACKARGVPKPNLETYEIWTPLTTYDDVTDISKIMPHKLRALRVHRSQLVEFYYERAIRGLNAFRGVLAARCRYAEVFQTANL